ncbi:hypothetical protein CROQUDRAFT_167906 [Cronartium quercuum f. sp. fusiforme G11]|uniref:Uncharacterized protein n=1 Tax=Cronartium quercuum f. sp. fusiforme G11 TaxID=708437 RepID=A0A9P6NCT8_9BASI|nr:hypothetical protein CROQUDRAFT_167906 [Cronartium quercuum f. sp. fusiforme G11]
MKPMMTYSLFPKGSRVLGCCLCSHAFAHAEGDQTLRQNKECSIDFFGRRSLNDSYYNHRSGAPLFPVGRNLKLFLIFWRMLVVMTCWI